MKQLSLSEVNETYRKEGWTMEQCIHENNETIEIKGTDESIVICHDCGCEI